MFPFLLKLYADGGYQGPEFQKALKRVLSQAEAQIVKRSDRQKRLRRVAEAMGGRTHATCPM